ncbi:hypothetical protein [Pseudomonas trivialis]|uniref:hypothetical protein n=1 Tax=Pseudomonas trivialis TaxID=200450 RepID=UPI003BAEF460
MQRIAFASEPAPIFDRILVLELGQLWGRPLATLLVLCILAVLPTIASGPHWLSFGLSLLFPLLGLLLLNRKRHREMRRKLVEVRRLRQAIIATRKAR